MSFGDSGTSGTEGNAGQALSAFGGAFGAAGSIIEGNSRADALRIQAKAAQTQGQQDQVARMTDLQTTLGAIRALTAQRGIDPNSPSAQAYSSGVEANADRNIQRVRANADAQAGADRYGASMASLGGYVGAGTSFFKAASQAADFFTAG